ncbi:MAG TPA: sigma-70 family RNA polymerase sigma factor [Terriglobales bacterium]|nr:sigma-70 family RNA polymerase sigma factor [Terriglobales bacterium]HZW92699.1 sigma-70 family RNA polymerase sigma factor [Candidatus Eremiobacteraceae bacterium]
MTDDESLRVITELLHQRTSSVQTTAPQLFDLIYKDLHHIAQAYMRRERPDHTLQATGLVNEAYLKVCEGRPFHWKNRKHLFCVMAQAMRRLLVDHARTHRANKRGGEWKKVPLDAAFVVPTERSPEFLALDEALQRLSRLDARQAQVVDLRYFVGLTVEETAAVLDVSPETVKLDWRFAKAWLHREIEKTV